MDRENLYLVLKLKDIKEYLTTTEITQLYNSVDIINHFRHREGRGFLECVVVEHDWTEYEAVWKMLEERVDDL